MPDHPSSGVMSSDLTTTTPRRLRPWARPRRRSRRDERAVERGQHAAFDEIEGGGLAVARPRQVDLDLVEDAAGARAHHHDAVGEHDRLVDVMGDQDQGRLGVGPQIEQMVLQIGAGKSIERGERLVEQQHFRPRHQRARNGDALRLAAG